MNSAKKSSAASVHQRLKNIAAKNGEDFNLLLIRFANERLLYRLSISEYKDRFLLKGAALFTLWLDVPHRPTRDIDMLGFGSSEIVDIEKIFADICEVKTEDGLNFKAESVKGTDIKESQEYQGVRISLTAFLGNARIYLQIDIGFGDAVIVPSEAVEFPVLLDFPKPKLKVYPKETVIAEKFEAMVKLGMLNSRMKDFWDINLLISKFEFDGAILQQAVRATFDRRQTAFPDSLPMALTAEFAEDAGKQTQWKAFLRKNKLNGSTDFGDLIAALEKFFFPLIESARAKQRFLAKWRGGSWHLNRILIETKN